MEYTRLLDTSLDLNVNPFRFIDEAPRKEVESRSIELGMKLPVKDEAVALLEELSRVSAENKKLTETLTVMCESYNELRSQLMDYMSKNTAAASEHNGSRKRKAESSTTITTANNESLHINGFRAGNGQSESSSSDEDSCKKPKEEHIKAKVSRFCVRTEASDTSLVVKDGYQWRKYGQKVTRDNPSPRAYFKCSFAPSCPVKKKVQRSVEDQSVLVATYEGEHNHPQPSHLEATSSGSSRCLTLASAPCSASLNSTSPTITLDLTKPNIPKPNVDAKNSSHRIDSSEFQRFLAEQMASTLTKDPSFKSALVAAISGKLVQHNHTEKW